MINRQAVFTLVSGPPIVGFNARAFVYTDSLRKLQITKPGNERMYNELLTNVPRIGEIAPPPPLLSDTRVRFVDNKYM